MAAFSRDRLRPAQRFGGAFSFFALAVLGSVGIVAAADAPAAPIAQAAGKAAVDPNFLIPRKTLFGNPKRAAAEISPDGKRISFLAPVDGVLNVWVAPIDHIDQAKPVTQDKKRGIRVHFWAYTSDHILYQQDAGGDENWHIYSVDLATNKTTDLTPLPNVAAQVEGVSHKFPNELLIGLNDRDERYHDVYKVDLRTAERKLVEKNIDFGGYVVDENFRIRFATKFSPDGGRLLLAPDGNGGWKEFLRIPEEDSLSTNPLGFDKSGDVLYMIDSRGRDTGALFTWNLKTDEKKLVAEDPRADISSILSHPTENTIEAVSFTYEREQWKFFDKRVEEDWKFLQKLSDGELRITSRSLDDKHWTIAFRQDAGAVKYYHFDREKKDAKYLFSNRDDLDGLPLVKMHAVVIKSRDGLDLVSYLSLPATAKVGADLAPDKPLPLVLSVHGGPWARDSWGFDPEHQLLANRGYAVLSVNFRGSTGFGKKFLNAGNKEWGAKMHDDLLDAVQWAVDKKIADPKKVAITGGSYGGYAALWAMTHSQEVFACGVDVVGPSSLITLLNTIPPYWASAMQMFKTRVGDHQTDEGKKFLNERSPLSFVDQIRKPLLIGQGKNDPRVKESEAIQIVAAMKNHKIPVTYVLFPDEGHGFARPQNNLAFTAITEAFFAANLGGRFQPIGEDFNGSSVEVPAGAEGVPGLAEALKAKPAPAAPPTGEPAEKK